MHFALTLENGPVIAHICRQVDGLPLTIELAAARVRMFTPQQLLAQLMQSNSAFAALGNGARTAPLRHATLQNTIEWSYTLLETEAERALFRRLAVFAGGARLEEIQAICHQPHAQSSMSAEDFLPVLESLLDKSLIVTTEAKGETRFAMLTTIRDYAWRKLLASGEVDAFQARHAQAYLQLAQTAELHLANVEQYAWLDWLDVERENFHTALAWALVN